MSRTTVWRRRGCTHVPRVYLPFEPLRAFVDAHFDGDASTETGWSAARRAGLDSRRWARYRAKGVPLLSADKVAVTYLGVHPAVIWGRDWWAAGVDL